MSDDETALCGGNLSNDHEGIFDMMAFMAFFSIKFDHERGDHDRNEPILFDRLSLMRA
ncbi:hypothetical protein JCM17846_09170 [Iodidimonas nitroreducens]|uniref:Uncharacterized protein n=1 Tax=Iodidimonas nitroreducens TaxID=1236968 RepID=A0A5A7N6G4_9PROT|nr:hypothetical protein JCM17846_09170 [Iodidimonas nitroreducens]